MIRFTDLFYAKTLIRQPSKLVNKKSWLQAVLKYCIKFSELEHLPLCDIYHFKLSLGIWSLELFLYKKQNRIFFSWKQFLSAAMRCSAEGASARPVEAGTYIMFKPNLLFQWEASLSCSISRLFLPSFFVEKMCWPEGNKQDFWLEHSSRNRKSVLCFLFQWLCFTH